MRFGHIDEFLPETGFRTLTGSIVGRLLTLEGKSSPPAPDYVGAANATAAGNLEAARAAAAANRVNQYTPYGNLIYTHTGTDPDSGWSATQTLSPAEQQKLDITNALSIGLLNTAQTGLGYVDTALASGGKVDEGKLAAMPISGQTVQDAIMSRLAPQLKRDRQSLRTQLVNQGLMQGSEGYNNAMEAQGQKENDLYTQAALQGINSALGARQQGIQEQYTAQDRPLNIVNALRTGNQVQTPNFVNVPQQQATAGADLLQASQLAGQYASGDTAAKNATTTSAASSIGMIAAMY